MNPTVLIFLKAPVAGAVKTRLAAEVGEARALRIYRGLAERQLAAIPAGWPVEVHFTPAGAEATMRAWLGEASGRTWHPQPDTDLGNRLATAVAGAFGRGAGAVVLIGGDCPGLGTSELRAAAAALRTCDAVMGPATDGGYYLLGLRAACPAWFADIAWSTPMVAAQTRAVADRLGLTLRELPKLRDVDTAADWQATGCLGSELG